MVAGVGGVAQRESTCLPLPTIQEALNLTPAQGGGNRDKGKASKHLYWGKGGWECAQLSSLNLQTRVKMSG